MAKKEEELEFDNIVTTPEETLTPVDNTARTKTKAKSQVKAPKVAEDDIVSCLRNERVIIRHIPKKGKYDDPKHVLYGGMSENAVKTYVVPKLTSGVYVNVLTNSEKKFLEDIMGLEHDALSIYNRTNNFWDDSNEFGISRVKLKKQDNYLNLSIPDDYIRYKILLANKQAICPSVKELNDHPKATYEYVIISEHDEGKVAVAKADLMVNAIEAYTKYKDDYFTLKTIIEIIERRRISNEQKIEFLRASIVQTIQDDSKAFLRVVSDPYFETKVLIKKAVSMGVIADRGGYLYYKETNTPLCNSDQEPTLSIAAKFLNQPNQSELLFRIQGALNS